MDMHRSKQLGVRPMFLRMDSAQDFHDYRPAPTPEMVACPDTQAKKGDKGLHLLSLPREIRDQIYSYLHHPVQTRWEINKQDVHCVAIKVPQAPFSAVLRTCSRLRDEYTHSRVMRKLSATISTTRATNPGTVAPTDLQCHSVQGSVINHSLPAPIEHITALFASIRDLTILMDNKRSMPTDSSIWTELQSLESMLSPFHSHLTTIRIGIHQCQDPNPLQMTTRRETAAYKDPTLPTPSFLPTPPTTFLSKPLIQRGAGYRLQLVLLQLHPSDPTDLLERFHRQKTGVYVYSTEPVVRLAREGLFWDEEEAVRSFPMNASWFNMQRSMGMGLRAGLGKVGVTDRWIQEEYGGLARRMVEWRERRGGEVGEWEG